MYIYLQINLYGCDFLLSPGEIIYIHDCLVCLFAGLNTSNPFPLMIYGNAVCFLYSRWQYTKELQSANEPRRRRRQRRRIRQWQVFIYRGKSTLLGLYFNRVPADRSVRDWWVHVFWRLTDTRPVCLVCLFADLNTSRVASIDYTVFGNAVCFLYILWWYAPKSCYPPMKQEEDGYDHLQTGVGAWATWIECYHCLQCGMGF